MRDLATVVLMGLGAAFTLLAALGLVRMPDVFNRMQAATKASTLGVFFMMLAAMVHFGTLEVGVRALLVIVFLFVTAPVAAHALSRAAYYSGVPLWPQSVRDELRDRYEPGTGRVLSSSPEAGKAGGAGRAGGAGGAGGAGEAGKAG